MTQWGGENPVFLGEQLSTVFWKFKNIDLKCLRGKLFPPLNSLPNQLLTFRKTIRQRLWAPRFLTSEYSIIKTVKRERKDERGEKDGLKMGCIPLPGTAQDSSWTRGSSLDPGWNCCVPVWWQFTLFSLPTSEIFPNPSLYGSETHCRIMCVFTRGVPPSKHRNNFLEIIIWQYRDYKSPRNNITPTAGVLWILGVLDRLTTSEGDTCLY